MNTFLTIMWFAVIATATANSGYNYQQPRILVKPNFRPQASASGSGIFSTLQAPPLTSNNVQPQPQQIKQNFIASPQYAPQQIELPAPLPQHVQQQLNVPSNVHNQPAPQYFAPVQQPGLSASSQVQFNQVPQQQTIISKDIYIHSAPEETEEITSEQGLEAGPIRKNYRIVFIKAPSQNIRFNLESLKRTQAANEEKTVIYVLSKKPDITNIQSQLSAIQTEPKAHKPEVFFIKYKTQDEADRAQQEIQAQYDALGGSTHISDEGIAPITSVIGGGSISVGSAGPILGSGSVSAPAFVGNSNFVQSASNNQQHFVQQSFQGSQGSASSVSFNVQAPSNKYLPAKKK